MSFNLSSEKSCRQHKDRIFAIYYVYLFSFVFSCCMSFLHHYVRTVRIVRTWYDAMVVIFEFFETLKKRVVLPSVVRRSYVSILKSTSDEESVRLLAASFFFLLHRDIIQKRSQRANLSVIHHSSLQRPFNSRRDRETTTLATPTQSSLLFGPYRTTMRVRVAIERDLK
jgi:hypothetical protein